MRSSGRFKMPNFKYRVRNEGGGMASGVVTAASEREAIVQLRNQSLTVLEVSAEAKARAFSFAKLFKPSLKPSRA